MSETPSQPLPGWVRLAVGRSSARQRAQTHLKFLVLNFLMFLAMTGLEWGSESVLGKVAVTLGLIGMVCQAVALFWVWLDIRWVDRNGQWE
jgi:hypothetical protein